MQNIVQKTKISENKALAKKIADWEKNLGGLKKLDETIEVLQEQISDKNKEKTKLRKELSTLESECDDLTNQISEVVIKTADAKTEIGRISAMVNADREKNETERESLKKDQDQFARKIAEAEADLKRRTQEVVDKEKSIKKYEDSIDVYAAKVDEFKNRLIVAVSKRGVNVDDAPVLDKPDDL